MILYASPAGGDATLCLKTQPCTIARAVALADATRSVIKMFPGAYVASITIGGKTVSIHGGGATLTAAAGQRTIEIDVGGHLQLMGLTVVNNNASQGIGISCQPGGTTPPIVELDQVTIDTAQTAVIAYPCTMTISRSSLHTRSSGQRIVYVLPTSTVTIDRSILDGGDGIQAEGPDSVARITNSVIKNQTGPDGAFLGSNLFGTGAGAVSVSFSTVIDSQVKCVAGTPRCAGGTSTGACIDNSIVYNTAGGAPADTVQGSACVTNYSLVYPQSTALTGSNNKLGVSPALKDAANSDYHLSSASAAIDAADPAATDMIDLDGVQRPQGPRSDLGAFEFTP